MSEHIATRQSEMSDHFFPFTATATSSASAISALRSASLSRPTDSRSNPSEMPLASRFKNVLQKEILFQQVFENPATGLGLKGMVSWQ
jgi:hypothetical protein